MKVSNSFLLTYVDSHKGPYLALHFFLISMTSDQVGQSYPSTLSVNNQLDSMLALCDELMLLNLVEIFEDHCLLTSQIYQDVLGSMSPPYVQHISQGQTFLTRLSDLMKVSMVYFLTQKKHLAIHPFVHFDTMSSTPCICPLKRNLIKCHIQ